MADLLDLSRWQRVAKAGMPDGYDYTIDWGKVWAAGHRRIFFKLTEGLDWVDPKAVERLKAARAYGFEVGVYHYFRNDLDPVRQARFFYDTVIIHGLLPLLTLKPALDVEDTRTASGLAAKVKACLVEIEARFDVRPVIYTRATYWNDKVLLSGASKGDFAGYVWWLAHYNSVIQAPWLPKDTAVWHLWQYTGSGLVDGIPGQVDRNRLNEAVGVEPLLWANPAAAPKPVPTSVVAARRIILSVTEVVADDHAFSMFYDNLALMLTDLQKEGRVNPYEAVFKLPLDTDAA